MARQRKISPLNIYHVIARGVGKQIIFEADNVRYNYLLGFAERYKGFNVIPLAWCLMDNHVHLLLEGDLVNISKLIHSLHTRFAMYLNFFHDRAGTVLDHPFKSEAIDTERYFLTVLRYIHLNPEKAGMASHNSYHWSSYRDYATPSKPTPHPFSCNTQKAIGILGSIDQFVDYHRPFYDSPSDFRVADINRKHFKLTEELIKLACEVLTIDTVDHIKSLPLDERNTAILKLVEAGLSVRQIERISGVSKSQIARIIGD